MGVTTSEKIIYSHYSGYAHYENEIQMHRNTVFDIASLTKVVATLPAILKLLESGCLDLSDPLYLYLPSFKENHSSITLKHLLTHTSGFQPGIKFYQKGYSLEESINVISDITDRDKPDEKVVYSDLNFIIIGFIVEKISGQSLKEYTQKNIYNTLNMGDTCFLPSEKKFTNIAATEFDKKLNEYQWGIVHDENARQFGGVSGHAGLFSTMADLASYCQMILNKGSLKGQKIFSEETINLSLSLATEKLNLNRALGWELYNNPSWSGQFLRDGFGHTGFTGTSLWLDPNKGIAVIILTNRVHFGRDTNISRFRRILHNLVALAMNDSNQS